MRRAERGKEVDIRLEDEGGESSIVVSTEIRRLLPRVPRHDESKRERW